MKPSLLELLTLHVAKRYLVFDMKRKVYITLSAVLLLIIVGCTLFIFIPNKTDKQLSAVCRVEGKAYYLLKVNKKDTEKREFNWKLVGGISMAVLTVAGISASVLGGKFDFNLPKKIL